MVPCISKEVNTMPITDPFEKYTSRYENWFEKNADIYRSELEALMSGLPRSERSLEIGVGTGRFAGPPGIRYGMDPSPKMLEVARKRGIQAVYGVAEELPFKDLVLDLVLMVTTVCFLDDIRTSFKEVYRVLRPGGSFVIGFVRRRRCIACSIEMPLFTQLMRSWPCSGIKILTIFNSARRSLRIWKIERDTGL
jgi:ubiquinone/menaquinone biosynthesis C-methylase UbiE